MIKRSTARSHERLRHIAWPAVRREHPVQRLANRPSETGRAAKPGRRGREDEDRDAQQAAECGAECEPEGGLAEEGGEEGRDSHDGSGSGGRPEWQRR